MNTALSWLIDSDLETITEESIKAAAQQLRDAFQAGDVHTIEVYFVHNTKETENVNLELATVEAALRAKLERWSSVANVPIAGVAQQLGLVRVMGDYESRHSSIRVGDTIVLKTAPSSLAIEGPGWSAMYTTIKW